MKLLILLLLTSCGVNVHVDPIKADPVQVNHTITIDYNLVSTYCQSKCNGLSNDPAVTQKCTDDCFHNFLDVLTHVTGGVK